MNIWLILHLASIVLLLLGVIIPSGMLRRQGAHTENRARRRWLIGAGLAAVLTMCAYIIDRTRHADEGQAIGGQEHTSPSGNTNPFRR